MPSSTDGQESDASHSAAAVPSKSDSRSVRVAIYMQRLLEVAAFRSLVSHLSGWSVVHTAHAVQNAADDASASAFDLLLVDEKLTSECTTEFWQRLLDEDNAYAVILLCGAMTGQLQHVPHSLRLHQISFDANCNEFWQLLCKAVGVSPRYVAGPPESISKRFRLTAREIEVWRQIADGYSVREISHRMQLAESTIDSHKSRLMKKLEARKSVELVRMAIRHGVTKV